MGALLASRGRLSYLTNRFMSMTASPARHRLTVTFLG